MSKAALLQQYRNDVINLKKCAKELGLREKQIAQLFSDCLKVIRKENESKSNAQQFIYTVLKCSSYFVLLMVFIYVLLNVHQPTSSIVLRNVQGLIYPGLKALRSLSVPIIKQYPPLTGLYDESCLVENPYFYVSDMECWPCAHIHSVMDVTGFINHSLHQTATPFVVKTAQNEVSFTTLQALYFEHKTVLDLEANSIKSINQSVDNLFEIFTDGFDPDTRITWRINKMLPARLMRKLFPRPNFISEWSGQSIERFVLIDGNKSEPYPLPTTECSYVFLIQGSGERTIILKPARECGDTCKTVSVILKQSYVLCYNWWYWRPISLPMDSASISYMNSYC